MPAPSQGLLHGGAQREKGAPDSRVGRVSRVQRRRRLHPRRAAVAKPHGHQVSLGHELSLQVHGTGLPDAFEGPLDGGQVFSGAQRRSNQSRESIAPLSRLILFSDVAFFLVSLVVVADEQSVALCTSCIMFVLTQDRLNMDLDRDSLELMLNLLETEAGQIDAVEGELASFLSPHQLRVCWTVISPEKCLVPSCWFIFQVQPLPAMECFTSAILFSIAYAILCSIIVCQD